ncbi:hypothetical protein MRX96_042360 [Rhipicephalus microplus]
MSRLRVRTSGVGALSKVARPLLRRFRPASGLASSESFGRYGTRPLRMLRKRLTLSDCESGFVCQLTLARQSEADAAFKHGAIKLPWRQRLTGCLSCCLAHSLAFTTMCIAHPVAVLLNAFMST